jgi:hypothetical protein
MTLVTQPKQNPPKTNQATPNFTEFLTFKPSQNQTLIQEQKGKAQKLGLTNSKIYKSKARQLGDLQRTQN